MSQPTLKRMSQLRVLLGFASSPANSLDEVAGAVLQKLYPNVRGPAQTADKNNKRDALVGLLRQLALYVQELHGNDMAQQPADIQECSNMSARSGFSTNCHILPRRPSHANRVADVT